MARQQKPVEHFAKLLASGIRLPKSTKVYAQRVVAGQCPLCAVAVTDGRRYCVKCQPPSRCPAKPKTLFPRTCQNPQCRREFMGRKHSKGCSQTCRSAIYRATKSPTLHVHVQPVVEPSAQLKVRALTAYYAWLERQRRYLTAETGRTWTDGQILDWAETNKEQWCAEWCAVKRGEVNEPKVEALPRDAWMGWQPSTTWNQAGGGSD